MRQGMDLRQQAQQLRGRGRRGDTVLAHINPAEAAYLAQHSGYDINPETGLPSFGLFPKFLKKLGQRFIENPVKQLIRHPVKTIARAAPAILGNMMWGIPGAIAAGAAHGATTRSSENRWKGAFEGALSGAALGYGAQKAGNLFGVSPSSAMGQGLGMGHAGIPGALAKLGITGGGGAGAGLGAKGAQLGAGAAALNRLQSMGIKAPMQEGEEQYGPEESGPLSWLNNGLVQKGLMATAIAGSLFGKSKYPQGTTLSEARDMLEQDRSSIGSNKEHYGRMKPLKRHVLNKEEREERHRKGLGYSYFDDTNPEPEYYASGGYVGYVPGNSSGEADDVLTEIPPDAFVWNGMDVSLLGDGNTAHGIQKLRALDAKYRPLGRRYQTGGRAASQSGIRAKVSSGEYIMSPEAVRGMGKGSGLRGATMIEEARRKLRKQKGVKAILPPKAKNIESYLR